MIIATAKKTERTTAEQFLYNGGYDDRFNGLAPQQWSDRNYRAGYAQAICDAIDSDAYCPVDYLDDTSVVAD